MKQSKDPFEAAFEEQEDSPPESPVDAFETQNPSTVVAQGTLADQEDDMSNTNNTGTKSAARFIPAGKFLSAGTSSGPMTNATKNKDDDDEEEEENMDVELGKFPSSGDPDKMAKMQAILSQFTEEQMSRYESFRRAGFQKANMKRLLASITGTQKISVPMTIVVSGIAKMFVGDVVETARIVMKERKESGPIRPCHLREAYRRLKLEGKVFKRSGSRLFR
ncbi:transcription initiation factor TFIID subunit 11 [Senna tora]|uniref:Transcription initiation factor TFIID subunit 11 n=1 Tax=Senna tora TaxID=362788 RepID=A0A834SDM0_9FABA|nr:transcription initiation factor TFIID subunit 11 [Senna tora]